VQWENAHLYRYPTGRWVLVSEFEPLRMADASDSECRKRIDDQAAADWFAANGLDCQRTLSIWPDGWKFDPSLDPVKAGASVDNSSRQWDADGAA